MLMIGSINAYTKNIKLQTQWELKQRNGDYSGHKTLEEWLGDTQARDEPGGKGDDALRAIHQKLEAGSKLTPEERRYLQAKDPEAYAKLEANERDQKAFEQKLRQCRTKEEVERLKMTYLSSSLTVVKSVEHNSAIPLNKKLEICMHEKQRCDMLEESYRKFARSGGYGQLPTENEAAKAQKDEEKTKNPEKEEKPVPESAEKQEPDKAEKRRWEASQIHTDSPEQRKVKKARAKAAAAAYSSTAGCTDYANTPTQVDLKA